MGCDAAFLCNLVSEISSDFSVGGCPIWCFRGSKYVSDNFPDKRFVTRHNCNPFDYQWSYSLDPLGGYLQLSYRLTLFTIDTEMGPKYASLYRQSLTCLQLSYESKFLIPGDTLPC